MPSFSEVCCCSFIKRDRKQPDVTPVSQFGPAVGRQASCSVNDVGSSPHFGCPFSSAALICGHRLLTLPLTINERLKRLSSLPTVMQKSFWW